MKRQYKEIEISNDKGEILALILISIDGYVFIHSIYGDYCLKFKIKINEDTRTKIINMTTTHAYQRLSESTRGQNIPDINLFIVRLLDMVKSAMKEDFKYNPEWDSCCLSIGTEGDAVTIEGDTVIVADNT